jgi:protein gp37
MLPHGRVVHQAGGEVKWNGEVIRNTDAIFYAMRATKPRRGRPQRVFVNSLSDMFHQKAIAEGMTTEVYYEMRACRWNAYQVLTKRPELAARWYADHPEAHHLPQVWLGTSVEDARVKGRIDILRAVPAAIRFISFEPLIGPVGDLDLTGVHWAIAGGESAPEPRPMAVEWVREIRDQCIAQGVKFFFKQWGGKPNDKGGHEKAVLDGQEWKEFPSLTA